MAVKVVKFSFWKNELNGLFIKNRMMGISFGDTAFEHLLKHRPKLAREVAANPSLDPRGEESRTSVRFDRFMAWVNANWGN